MSNPNAPAIEWTTPLRPIGPPEDPWSRLLGAVRILGSYFHVQAEQVVEDEYGLQRFTMDGDEHFVDDVLDIVGGKAETVVINGRYGYILSITPYQA